MSLPLEQQPNSQPEIQPQPPVSETTPPTLETVPEPAESYESLSRSTEAKINEQIPGGFVASSHKPNHSNEFLTDNEKAIVQGWVNLYSTHGEASAIKAVKDVNNPALTDQFHSALTGELYQQMVDQGKLEVVK